jgi:hypothetical protein
MDDIGNLVYLLVFVIWFLYKIFGKGKKKTTRPLRPVDTRAPEPKTQEQSSRDSTSPPMTFEDVLRELTGAPSVPRKRPEIYQAPDPYPVEDIPNSMEETSFEVYETPRESQPVTDTVMTGRASAYVLPQARSSKAAKGALRMLKTKQGAKQAFIMKEIFDRKY